MTIGELVKTYRIEHGLSMDAFAGRCGLSKAYISMLEKNRNSKTGEPMIPGLKTLKSISVAMNISFEELIKLLDSNQLDILSQSMEATSNKANAVRINVYGSIPAGVPIEAIEDIEDWEEIPVDMTAGGKQFIALRVKGDSMWPRYMEGDIVILQLQPDCESGQDCAVYVNGYEATLKTIKKSDHQITLSPYNTNYSPKTYRHPGEVVILGVVVELRRKMQ